MPPGGTAGTGDGAVYVCGDNDYGKLGLNDTDNRHAWTLTRCHQSVCSHRKTLQLENS